MTEASSNTVTAPSSGQVALLSSRLEGLPELLPLFSFPRPLRRKVPITNVIERCFIEVRRRSRPAVCFTNVASIDRIIFAIFHGMHQNHQWKNRTLHLFAQAA